MAPQTLTADPIRDYADAVRARMDAERDTPRAAGPHRAAETDARMRVIGSLPIGKRWNVMQALAIVRDAVGTAGYLARYGTRDQCQRAQGDLARAIRTARDLTT